MDVPGLASSGHPRHGRPTPDTEGPLLPKGQFEVPALEVSKPAEPEVARVLEEAIQRGEPTLLQRTTDKSIIRQNRAEATRGWDYTKGSPDEFPYVSTMQGGKRGHRKRSFYAGSEQAGWSPTWLLQAK